MAVFLAPIVLRLWRKSGALGCPWSAVWVEPRERDSACRPWVHVLDVRVVILGR